jgi:putative acetyltransferase
VLSIRPFRIDDLPALTRLFRDTVRRVNIRDYSEEQVRAWAPDDLDPEIWGAAIPSRYPIVAEIEGGLVGFGELEDDGHLNRFYVHADHQRLGVGRSLLTALEEEAHRRGMQRLFTEASITARPFFARHGFHLIAEQTVKFRGVLFINYRMDKQLCPLR